MKTPRWICAKCRQPFTRRWNAYRHSNNKHFGAIETIISFTEYIINRPDSIPLNGFYEDNNSHPINVKNQLFFDKPIPFNNEPFDTLLEPLEAVIERELLSYEILDQLAPKYEELQRVLDCVPESYRKILLGNALSAAINSNNPIEFMHKQLTGLRKAKSRVMMLNDLTAFYGKKKTFTKEFLKLILKQKEYRHLTNKISW